MKAMKQINNTRFDKRVRAPNFQLDVMRIHCRAESRSDKPADDHALRACGRVKGHNPDLRILLAV